MKILLNDPPPAWFVDPQKAAALLTGEAHLVFIGFAEIPEHRDFFSALPAAASACSLFIVQEPDYRWAPHGEMKVVVTQAVDPGRSEYLLAFVPDGTGNRLAPRCSC